jgi:deferrochelatase/peroxidase EfeB
MQVDLSGVQALIVHRMHRPISRHLLFRFDDSAGGRAFVGELAPRVGMADVDPAVTVDPVLGVGITFSGLGALGVAPDLLSQFDAVYKTGPQAAPLGDVPGSRSDPAGWWERRFTTRDVHFIVHCHASSDVELDEITTTVRDIGHRNRVTELIPRADGTVLEGRSLGDSRVHFGYRDGISQPDVAWDDVPRRTGQLDFRRILLGYSTPEHSSAPGIGPAAELVRGSAYGMFRWIYQDVALFHRFLGTAGPRAFPDLPPADAAELLAAKLVGRWRDGVPLVLSPDVPTGASSTANDFGYRDPDPAGQRCPLSAHIRVVNPRDQPLDAVVVDGVPRVLRRGVPYGPPLTGPDDDGVDRGLLGLFLCADLRRQVYMLCAWINRNDFSPVFGVSRRTQDALAGNRAISGIRPVLRIPGPRGELTVDGLPDFLTTKGTAFFLYPGRATLAALATSS